MLLAVLCYHMCGHHRMYHVPGDSYKRGKVGSQVCMRTQEVGWGMQTKKPTEEVEISASIVSYCMYVDDMTRSTSGISPSPFIPFLPHS